MKVSAEVIVTEDYVTFTPTSCDGGIGYEITAPNGATEYVLLVPTTLHQVNPDNGAIADTFLYVVDAEGAALWRAEEAGPGTGLALTDLGESVAYVNHFAGYPSVADGPEEIADAILRRHVIHPEWVRNGEQIRELLIEAASIARKRGDE